MSALPNYRLPYRPLIAGVAISSPEVGSFGTLGCFARSDDGTLWGLTARHVVSLQPAVPARVSVFQADFRRHTPAISDSRVAARGADGLDIVAFALASRLTVSVQIVGLGSWRGVGAPRRGMRVWKAGAATGITTATVGAVASDRFELIPEAGMPAGYLTFDDGDSGSAWMTREGGLLLGIHVAQQPRTGIGSALRLDACLARLGLAPA